MKILILKEADGEYEDYQEYIWGVFEVPDNFDINKFRKDFYSSLKNDKDVKLTKKGNVSHKYRSIAKYKFKQKFIDTFKAVVCLEEYLL